ncbi:hypothetical protein P3X46_026133 [Hevea brasiliensis]|uniref:Uncharacterized protein n=1 Tax=Hevea brasiliensis TaxID=3981 RepID=A0ABQ9KXA3_HEVBR|nr:hypothetical protein P3X46_026133 [Hevea brasiliensis]
MRQVRKGFGVRIFEENGNMYYRMPSQTCVNRVIQVDTSGNAMRGGFGKGGRVGSGDRVGRGGRHGRGGVAGRGGVEGMGVEQNQVIFSSQKSILTQPVNQSQGIYY